MRFLANVRLHEDIDEKIDCRIEKDERVGNVFDNNQAVGPDGDIETVVTVPKLVDCGDHSPDVAEEEKPNYRC